MEKVNHVTNRNSAYFCEKRGENYMEKTTRKA